MVTFSGDTPPGNIGDGIPGPGPGVGGRQDTYGLNLDLSQRIEEIMPVAGAATADAVRRAVQEARTTGIGTGVVNGVENHRCWVQMDDGGIPGQENEGFVTCLRMNPGIINGSRVRVHFDGSAMAEAHGPIAQSPSPAILPTVLFTSSAQSVSSSSLTNAALSISAESGDFDWEISGTTIFLPSGGFFLLTFRATFEPDVDGIRFATLDTTAGTLLSGDQGTGMSLFSTILSGAGILRGAPGAGVFLTLFHNAGNSLNTASRVSLSLIGDEPE